MSKRTYALARMKANWMGSFAFEMLDSCECSRRFGILQVRLLAGHLRRDSRYRWSKTLSLPGWGSLVLVQYRIICHNDKSRSSFMPAFLQAFLNHPLDNLGHGYIGLAADGPDLRNQRGGKIKAKLLS